jgi:hypothetical protein
MPRSSFVERNQHWQRTPQTGNRKQQSHLIGGRHRQSTTTIRCLFLVGEFGVVLPASCPQGLFPKGLVNRVTYSTHSPSRIRTSPGYEVAPARSLDYPFMSCTRGAPPSFQLPTDPDSEQRRQEMAPTSTLNGPVASGHDGIGALMLGFGWGGSPLLVGVGVD